MYRVIYDNYPFISSFDVYFKPLHQSYTYILTTQSLPEFRSQRFQFPQSKIFLQNHYSHFYLSFKLGLTIMPNL